MSNKFPEKTIRLMLHAMGISHTNDNSYIQPNKRYSPYPTSHRNYYQISDCEDWNALVESGLAIYRKGAESWQDCYSVTNKGKDHLRKHGYKWHEEKEK